MPDHLIVRRTGRILEITLDRPEKRNAITGAMYAGMADAVRGAGDDLSVAAVIFTGGEHFTSGNDVADFLKSPPSSHTDETPVFRFLDAIASTCVPLIAAVRGYATGVGTTLLLHCDFVIAGESARFHTPFVDMALVPEAGSSLLLPLTAGLRRAARMLLLGEPIDAGAALACDLASEVLADDDVLPRARALAETLAKKPPLALRASKALMKSAIAAPLRAQMDREGERFLESLRSPEAAEAMRAFLEKRAPQFTFEAETASH